MGWGQMEMGVVIKKKKIGGIFVLMEIFCALTTSMTKSGLQLSTVVLQDIAIGGKWRLQIEIGA